MKILTVHNRYKFRGGEDESREAEDTLLVQRGHDIRQIVFDNAQINSRNAVKVGIQATWSHTSYRRIRDYLSFWRPDILDVHNFFPLVSPSIYYAARGLNVPVVQTLHNYRILCPGANFYRNGVVCEDCTRHVVPWPAVLHGCYRGSSAQTGAVALMVSMHRIVRTWTRMVDLFFVPSRFAMLKFVENGLPESRMVVKPNFVVDPGPPGPGGDEFLFVGRLSPEKGIGTLIRAIARAQSPKAKFRIIGDGPLEPLVREAALRDARIVYCGRQPLLDVMRAMAQARALIVPSECYETFGRAAAEAFAAGTPVICPDTGAVTEIVDDGRTGCHFKFGDAADLARIIDDIASSPGRVNAMRGSARAAYKEKYTPERGYRMLVDSYESAISDKAAFRAARAGKRSPANA